MISQLSKNTWLGRKISQFPGGFTVLLDLVLFLKCSNLASFECASVCRTWVLESNTICKWILPPPPWAHVSPHTPHMDNTGHFSSSIGKHPFFFLSFWHPGFWGQRSSCMSLLEVEPTTVWLESHLEPCTEILQTWKLFYSVVYQKAVIQRKPLTLGTATLQELIPWKLYIF